MRLFLAAVFALSLVSACNPAPPPTAAAPAAAPAPVAAPAPAAEAPKPAEAPKAAEAPKPAEAVAPAAEAPAEAPAPAEAAAPAPNALPTMAQIGDMEKTPGATPPLEGATIPSPNTVKSFPGAPGPHPVAGPNDAPVRVFVFSDFQCPVCSRVVEPMKLLAREFPEQVQISFIHNALEMHQNASGAAAAAIAAQRQGKFWAFHDKLFQNQQSLHEQDLILYAEELGLNSAQFQKDMKDPAVKAQVDYERALAAEMELQGTPGFIVNGHKQVGWGSYGGFKSMVTRALQAMNGATGPDAAMKATAASGDDGKKFAELYWGKKK